LTLSVSQRVEQIFSERVARWSERAAIKIGEREVSYGELDWSCRPMPGRGAALEDLDDDHASAAAWTRVREGGRLVAIMIIGIGSLALGFLATEQFAGACDIVGAGSLGEQAVVADAVEALGQDVDEEAADELVCCERHHLVAIRAFEPIVLVLEADSVFVERDQPAVGDGDAVGVAGQIS